MYSQTVTIATFVPPTTTPNPPADFSFQNGVAETYQVMTFTDGSIPVASCTLVLDTTSAFASHVSSFTQNGGDLEPNFVSNGIEWTYRGNSYTDASLLNAPTLFKYYIEDSSGQMFYFEHYFTLRTAAALTPPTF